MPAIEEIKPSTVKVAEWAMDMSKLIIRSKLSIG